MESEDELHDGSLEGDLSDMSQSQTDQEIVQLNNNRSTEPELVQEGETATEEEAVRFLQANPRIDNYFKKLIRDGIAEENKNRQQEVNLQQPPGKESNGMMVRTPQSKKNGREGHMVKSPSDTTIYAPALKKLMKDGRGMEQNLIDRISNFLEEIHIEGSREHTPKCRTGAPKEKFDSQIVEE